LGTADDGDRPRVEAGVMARYAPTND